MENLIIDKTESTPKVVVDYNNAVISFEGICVPENSTEFFDPIFEEVKKIMDDKQRLTYDFYLEYFNTSSSKKILDIFLLASDHTLENDKFKVLWKSDEDDEELLEAGEIMQEMSNLPFEYIEVKE